MRIQDKFGVEKFIEHPLRGTTENVFIVLDGFDEADETTMDETERKLGLDILIERLRSLPHTRTFFISRPPTDVRV